MRDLLDILNDLDHIRNELREHPSCRLINGAIYSVEDAIDKLEDICSQQQK